jgi:pSer/pThr/pTyr-binding forkhead associated (FHA) protein
MHVGLVMFRADEDRRSFELPKDVTVVGRREDCDLRIPLNDVSRKHCRLVKDEEHDELLLEDLGSSNGTYVNGQRVRDATLEPGDSIQIGSVLFVVQIDGDPPLDQLRPVVAVGENADSGADNGVAPVKPEPATDRGDRPFDPMDALTEPADVNEESGLEFDVAELLEEQDVAEPDDAERARSDRDA